MAKKRFDDMQATTIEQAQRLAKRMIAAEARGPGDWENARHRLESKYGVNLWSLLYRKPKDIGVQAVGRLRAAYLDHCESVIRRTRHEIKIEQAKGAADVDAQRLLAEAESLLAKIEAARGS